MPTTGDTSRAIHRGHYHGAAGRRQATAAVAGEQTAPVIDGDCASHFTVRRSLAEACCCGTLQGRSAPTTASNPRRSTSASSPAARPRASWSRTVRRRLRDQRVPGRRDPHPGQPGERVRRLRHLHRRHPLAPAAAPARQRQSHARQQPGRDRRGLGRVSPTIRVLDNDAERKRHPPLGRGPRPGSSCTTPTASARPQPPGQQRDGSEGYGIHLDPTRTATGCSATRPAATTPEPARRGQRQLRSPPTRPHRALLRSCRGSRSNGWCRWRQRRRARQRRPAGVAVGRRAEGPGDPQGPLGRLPRVCLNAPRTRAVWSVPGDLVGAVEPVPVVHLHRRVGGAGCRPASGAVASHRDVLEDELLHLGRPVVANLGHEPEVAARIHVPPW